MINSQAAKGITLIETLIAIFVLAVGIVGVLAVFPIGIQVAKTAQMATRATHLGQAKIEEIISQPYPKIAFGVSIEEYGTISDFKAYKRKTEVTCFDANADLTPNCPDTGIKKILVTVFWRSPLGVTEKSINLISLISRR